ncbi:DNA polymerase nu-like [Thrips palmi]|uniref:DNA polymerase nu-like n=1 Tax=Thrips palmi TaxID=161013 RepID=A0A6P8YYC0_THRPL|nr:DNA polymerase nu-like [Thrips palmi]
MDLVWLRPAKKPVRPWDIEDLSSPARRVLQHLERRFPPRNPVCIASAYQPATRYHDSPVPFFGLSAPPQSQGRNTFNFFSQRAHAEAVSRGEPLFRPGRCPTDVENYPCSRQPDDPSRNDWPPYHSVVNAHQGFPTMQLSQQRQEGVFVPRNILTNLERPSTEENPGNTEGQSEACGSGLGNVSILDISIDQRSSANPDNSPPISNYDAFDDELLNSFPAINATHSPPISCHDFAESRSNLERESSEETIEDIVRQPEACGLKDGNVTPLADISMDLRSLAGPHNSPPFSEKDMFDEDIINDGSPVIPLISSPPFSSFDNFEEEGVRNFHNVSPLCPELQALEDDKENFRRSGSDRFNNTGELEEHIECIIRMEQKGNDDVSSPLKDITRSLNETNCSNVKKTANEGSLLFAKEKPSMGCESPQIDQRHLRAMSHSSFTQSPSSVHMLHMDSAPAFSPQTSKGPLETDFSFDDIFDPSGQNNILEENNLQYKSPIMAKNQSSSRQITPGSKNRKKFLGTPFQRALSSNSLITAVVSEDIPLTTIETPNKINENKSIGTEHISPTMNQNNESFPLIQNNIANEKASAKPPSPLFPIFNVQRKRKNVLTENLVSQPTTSCKKKLKFVVPFKKKEQDVKGPSSLKDIQALSLKLSKEVNSRQLKMQNLTEILAHDIRQKVILDPPQEMSMTLQYRGGFCQLNRPGTSGTLSPESVLVRIMWSSDIKFISIPVQKYSWSSDLVKTLFSDKGRKVCFEAQTMIQLMVDKFGFNASEVSSQWIILDPLIGCWLLNPDKPPQTFKDVLSMMKISEEMGGIEILLSKLSECAKVLYEHLTKRGLWKLFLHIEMRITPILACMELHGIQVDVNKFQDMGNLLRVRLEDVQKMAYKAAGRQFQLTSPQQLGHVLYDHLKLDMKHNISVKETDKKHNKSTSEPTLIKFKDVHPLPGVMLEFRRLHKLKSTYVDAILGHVSENRIYSSWDQTSAATGRITSSDPNLQTIPKQPLMPDQPDLLLRTAFVARKGYSFLTADFQHIELRVFAHLSKDTALIRALSQSTDVFKILSQHWLQIEDISKVSEEDRDKTKRIMYSLMYGAGASKLVEFLHIDYNQASKILQKFAGTFPKMEDFTKSVVRDCRKQGYLTTETGRIRLFPNINSPNFQIRMHSERQAVNFLVQGTAADLCKCAMVQTQRFLTGIGSQKRIPQACLLLQIHDELLWEIPDADVMDAADVVQTAMEGATSVFQGLSNFSVPLPVVMKIGKSWGDLKIVKNTSLGTASQLP